MTDHSEAHARLERMLREWEAERNESGPYEIEQDEADQIMADVRQLLDRADRLEDENERLREEGIAENCAIHVLTGNPREGYTLPEEIRAQLEESRAEIDELRERLRQSEEIREKYRVVAERAHGLLDCETPTRKCHGCPACRVAADIEALRSAAPPAPGREGDR